MKKDYGIVIVFTGNGKGKTSSALGIALRAGGHDMKTLIIQFLKEDGMSGEQKACRSIDKNIDIYSFGKGFVFRGDDPAPHIEAVEMGWNFMKNQLSMKKYNILILDELNVAISLGLFPVNKVIDFLREKDNMLHVIITGRGAPSELIESAHIVTEMKEIKHIYNQGVTAIAGLDY